MRDLDRFLMVQRTESTHPGRRVNSYPVGVSIDDQMEDEMSETAAIDPVCGMTVDPATAISAEVDGQTYYFCASGCRKAFLKNPAEFLGEKSQAHGGHHAAGMHHH